MSHDAETGLQTIHVLRDDGGGIIEDIGVEADFRKELDYRLDPEDPATARASAVHEIVYRHVEGSDTPWDTRIHSRAAIACTADSFILEADLEAFEGERRIFSRSWTRRIARDLM